jgi:hypothetical protein
METTLLKGYVVCLLKTNTSYIEHQLELVQKSGFNYSTIEEAEASIPESNWYDTYTILTVYRRIKTEAK